MRTKAVWWGVGLLVAGLGAVAGVQAQSLRQVAKVRAAPSDAVEDRWRDSLEAFAAADRLQAPQPGGVLFVGSSSIRLWEGVETAFQATPVLRRGFGGSRMLDCALHVDRLVLPYAPRLVLVYAGDNDLAEGRSPEQILQSFTQFVDRVHEALPGTRIAYLSVKPSPSRAALMPLAEQTNRLIADFAAMRPGLDFIDIYSRMLGDDGRPRGDLFQADALHLNATGYALWQSVIASYLAPRRPSVAAAEAAPAPASPLRQTVAGP